MKHCWVWPSQCRCIQWSQGQVPAWCCHQGRSISNCSLGMVGSKTALSWVGSNMNKRIKERVAAPAAACSSLYWLCTEEMWGRLLMWWVLTGNGLIMIWRDVQIRNLLYGSSDICCHMIGSKVFSVASCLPVKHTRHTVSKQGLNSWWFLYKFYPLDL